MQSMTPTDIILNADDLARRAAVFVAIFEKKLAPSAPLNATFAFHREPSSTEGSEQARPAVFSEWTDDRIVIHLDVPSLVGIPSLALQGWLDFELAAIVVRRQPALYRYNFKRDIFPLFPVSGTAIQFIRYVVSHLEACLKRAGRTELILKMEHGQSLAYYHYQTTATAADEEIRSYRNLAPHKWMRAIYVSKKSKEFVPVALLDAGGCLPGIASLWWRCHAYLLPEDQKILQKVAAAFLSHRHDRFSEQMVAAFEAVRSDLLI
ncbi:MAG: hypothetical protein WAK95_20945 [Desulfobacterales bacterium]